MSKNKNNKIAKNNGSSSSNNKNNKRCCKKQFHIKFILFVYACYLIGTNVVFFIGYHDDDDNNNNNNDHDRHDIDTDSTSPSIVEKMKMDMVLSHGTFPEENAYNTSFSKLIHINGDTASTTHHPDKNINDDNHENEYSYSSINKNDVNKKNNKNKNHIISDGRKPSSTTTTTTRTNDIKSTLFFDITNPSWPTTPPKIRNDCTVRFKNPNMTLCHIIPWANFGDELGPPIVKRILELIYHCSARDLSTFNLKHIYSGGGDGGYLNRTGHDVDTCFMVVGSLWRMMKTGDHIWGTGVAYGDVIKKRCRRPWNNTTDNNNNKTKEQQQKKRKNRQDKVQGVTIYSSRGPLSAKQIETYCSFTNYHHQQQQHNNNNTNTNSIDKNNSNQTSTIEGAGDAGYLVPFVFPEHVLDKNQISTEKNGTNGNITCIIPHKSDEGREVWKSMEGPYRILNVGIGWVNMTLQLQACDEVISSSLHGIILAEALGIPNTRLRLSSKPGDFKFDDFYASYRRIGHGKEENDDIEVGVKKKIRTTGNMQKAMKNMFQPMSYHERDEYAKRILRTFPIHLFETIEN